MMLTFSKFRRSRVARFAAGAALVYGGVLVVLLFLEDVFVFHPVRFNEDWLPPPNVQVQDINLQTADGTRIHAWWCPCENADGTLLYCHGNAGNLSHRGEGIKRWHQHLRHNVLIFDYPGYGRSAGKPSEHSCYRAAAAAYDWLIDSGKTTPETLLLYGTSLGGGVAIELATHRPHRALVVVSAFASIPDMAQRQFPWLPARWLVKNRFDNIGKIQRCSRPIFIAHGDCDSIVPLTQGQKLFEAAPEPKEFLLRGGCDHNFLLDPEFFAKLKRFLAEKAPLGTDPSKASKLSELP